MTLFTAVCIAAFVIWYFDDHELFWVLAWPGTVVHELLHYTVGLVLLAQPCNLSVIPKPRTEHGQELGRVDFQNIGWWNALPTGMAPLLGLPIALVASSLFQFTPTITGFLGAWIIASIISQCWPSRTDFSVAFENKVGLVFWAGVAYLAMH